LLLKWYFSKAFMSKVFLREAYPHTKKYLDTPIQRLPGHGERIEKLKAIVNAKSVLRVRNW
jgi:hypothetical protein